jgi:choline dehydrogenase-like flavoprotein
MFDVIMIGARCAGAVTAMLLARRGHRVLLLERGVIPSDVHRGHFIHKHGPKGLAEWGLLDRIVATNCPPITTHLRDSGDFQLIGRDIRLGIVAWGYGPRRQRDPKTFRRPFGYLGYFRRTSAGFRPNWPRKLQTRGSTAAGDFGGLFGRRKMSSDAAINRLRFEVNK